MRLFLHDTSFPGRQQLVEFCYYPHTHVSIAPCGMELHQQAILTVRRLLFDCQQHRGVDHFPMGHPRSHGNHASRKRGTSRGLFTPHQHPASSRLPENREGTGGEGDPHVEPLRIILKTPVEQLYSRLPDTTVVEVKRTSATGCKNSLRLTNP